jgi:ubiquinol-cytochrome c reductase iron-sulfur subunit
MSFNVAESLATTAGGTDVHADPSRRDFIHIAAATAVIGGVVAVAWPMIDQMNPAADTLAVASTEFDMSKVALGQQVEILWRKQPVFVRHRTPQEIARARADDHAPDLKDPELDAQRVKPGHADWLVVLASCTHLGCVPTFGQGDYGGWLCPCHGSQYDTSGRIRKGPAPKNLVVPEYAFTGPTKVKIG